MHIRVAHTCQCSASVASGDLRICERRGSLGHLVRPLTVDSEPLATTHPFEVRVVWEPWWRSSLVPRSISAPQRGYPIGTHRASLAARSCVSLTPARHSRAGPYRPLALATEPPLLASALACRCRDGHGTENLASESCWGSNFNHETTQSARSLPLSAAGSSCLLPILTAVGATSGGAAGERARPGACDHDGNL